MGVTDMSALRVFMIGASSCGIMFNLLQPVPLVVPAAWGAVFVFGHSVQIARLLWDKVEVSMSSEEADLYETAFMPSGFTPRQFVAIIAHAKWIDVPAGHVLFRCGEQVNELYYLVRGKVSTIIKSNAVNGADVVLSETVGGHAGAWLGNDNEEAGYTTVSRSRLCVWDKGQIQQMINSNPVMRTAGDKAHIQDLCAKLKTAQLADTEHLRRAIITTYKQMLAVAVVDGVLVDSERDALARYCEENDIDTEQHTQFLSEIGWVQTADGLMPLYD
jgi:CRP-like cAMP-binding protein